MDLTIFSYFYVVVFEAQTHGHKPPGHASALCVPFKTHPFAESGGVESIEAWRARWKKPENKSRTRELNDTRRLQVTESLGSTFALNMSGDNQVC